MSSSQLDSCAGSSRDGGTGGFNSGDWICGDVTCSHLNFARRQQCNKCQRDRSLERSSSVGSGSSSKKKLGSEIGKAAAEKSRGLFSAEDWQCNKCANVNWARRSTCNLCNAPKFNDVEERTGFGGGYNDRGIVEYKEREESDSEYDEFGRLKKHKKNSHNNDNSKIKKPKEKEDDYDEEEEEDGDDDDLAKYNLFSDDDEVPAVKSSNFKPTNDKAKSLDRRSRSRTRSNIKRRPSHSSSRGSSSSSSSTSSSTSSTSSSTSSSTTSTSTSSRHSTSLQKSNPSRKRSRSCSHSRPTSPLKRQRSSSHDDNIKKRSDNKAERLHGYSSQSRSKSRSSHNSSRSPPTKRNRSRNSSSSRKHSLSQHSHRKITKRSRSMTPRRKR